VRRGITSISSHPKRGTRGQKSWRDVESLVDAFEKNNSGNREESGEGERIKKSLQKQFIKRPRPGRSPESRMLRRNAKKKQGKEI